MLTLDIDEIIVEQAVNEQIDLIITHHPFIFSGLKSIDFNTYEGRIIQNLINNNINLYSMHTSFDMADAGVNQKLASKLGIQNYETLKIINQDLSGYGGVSDINPVKIEDYAKEVKNNLNALYIKLYCNDSNRVVKRVAFCGGSGSDFINDAIEKKADVYITGDIKYHQAQTALNNNLCIIDAGHFNTEYHSLENVRDVLINTRELHIILIEKNSVKEQII